MTLHGGVVVSAPASLTNSDFDFPAESEGWGRELNYTPGTTTTTIESTSTTSTTSYNQGSNPASRGWNRPVSRAWQVGAIKCDDSVAVAGGG
jgi:hypothetical protein